MMSGGKTEKIFVLTITITLVLSAASLSFGAGELKMEGKVGRINGNEVTISDGKGKEQTVESRTTEIKVGDTVTLRIDAPEQALDIKLSPQDIEFLTKECQIDPADVNVIPKLLSWTDADLYIQGRSRKCHLLEPFKNTREYLRKLTPPPEKPPFPLPPKGYNRKYLTDEECDYLVATMSRLWPSPSKTNITSHITSHMRGTVTGINGKQITITYNNGKQTTFEISDSYLKVGEAVIVRVEIEVNKNSN
jgi:hypothetical protein